MNIKKLSVVLLLGIGVFMSGCKKDTIKCIELNITNDPIISFNFVFHVGSMMDPEGKNGLTYLTATLMTAGSTQKNKYRDILKKLYPIASSYNVNVDREYISFTGRTHKDNIDRFYTLFKEALLEPAFIEEDFNRLRTGAVNHLKNTLRYGDDEELGKAVFKAFLYKGTLYEKNILGKISGLENITLEDARNFYKENFTRDRLLAGVSGNFETSLIQKIKRDFSSLPRSAAKQKAEIIPAKFSGLHIQVVEKNADATGIHIGFPITLMRKDVDFPALFLANYWFGVHRNSASHLYQVIREARGMNYGDYSYIEDFPGGGRRMVPPTNVYKNPQLFEIWIRPVETRNRLFALRAAVRELKKLVENGMSKEDFELTRKALAKAYLHFAANNAQVLGYRIDDHIFGLQESYLENFRKNIESLTLEQVNRAIKKYLQYENLKIVFVTSEAEQLKNDLINNTPSPITYRSEKSEEVLQEDKIIEVFPLPVKQENIEIINIDDVFK